jgi:O-antigen/teichoic acid export membrane protein
MIKKGSFRNFGYLAWTVVEQVAGVGLPRLVLFPLAIAILGKDSFGVFATALSITLIVGVNPSGGLILGVLRQIAGVPREDQPSLLATAGRLTHWALLLVVSLGLVVAVLLTLWSVVHLRLFLLLVPLTITLYSDNVLSLILTEDRYRREFRQRALWYLARSLAVIGLALLGGLLFGEIGLAWGYLLGSFSVAIILRWVRAETYERPSIASLRRGLVRDWLPLTIAGIIGAASPYLVRVILASYHSYEQVASLIAASAIMVLFFAPILCVEMLIFSLLARYTELDELPTSAKGSLLTVLLIGGAIGTTAYYFGSRLLLHLLFPQFGQETVVLLDILLLCVPAMFVISIARPLVVKFASSNIVPVINIVAVIVGVVSAVSWIPIQGAEGGARTLRAVYVSLAVLWSLANILHLRKSQPPSRST